MYSKKMKMMSAFVMSAFFFSGCGVSESLNSATSSVSSLVSGSAETAELQILENLPEGTFAFASKNTTGLQSKADIVLSLKQYLPEEMKSDLEENFSEIFQKEFLSGYVMGGLNYAGIVRPKVDEILFASFPTNPDAIAQENICAAGKFVFQKKRAKAIVSEILKNEKMSADISEENKADLKNFSENMDKEIQKISEKIKAEPDYEAFAKQANFTLSTTDDLIVAEISTKACDENDLKILADFQSKVYAQDTMNAFVSVDRKFFAPFLAKGNLAVVKIAIAEGEKQIWAEAEQNGFDVEKLKTLKSEILDPWGRTNFVKMWKSFEKVSYVSGYVKGNLADRESELLIKFSDEKMAELFAEIQEGKIPANKMWLHDGAKFTAKVSRNGGTVYDYAKFENTEYPSILGVMGGDPQTVLVVITVVGILATGATALYSKAQAKARAAQQINNEQSLEFQKREQESGDEYGYSY